MKKLLAVLAVLVAGIGVWAGYRIFINPEQSAEFYVEKVNQALLDNQPQQAFDYINQGIVIYPGRLDLRFGKIYMCQMLENYDCMREEIVKVLDDAALEGHEWKWLKNDSKDNAFMLGVIQNYQKVFWEAERDDDMKAVAEVILRDYPDHVESLNVMAVSYMLKEDWKNAEPYLVNAQKLAPDDEIVKKNMQEFNQRRSNSTGK